MMKGIFFLKLLFDHSNCLGVITEKLKIIDIFSFVAKSSKKAGLIDQK